MLGPQYEAGVENLIEVAPCDDDLFFTTLNSVWGLRRHSRDHPTFYLRLPRVENPISIEDRLEDAVWIPVRKCWFAHRIGAPFNTVVLRVLPVIESPGPGPHPGIVSSTIVDMTGGEYMILQVPVLPGEPAMWTRSGTGSETVWVRTPAGADPEPTAYVQGRPVRRD